MKILTTREFHEMNVEKFSKELENLEYYKIEIQKRIDNIEHDLKREKDILERLLKERRWAIINLENSKNALIAMDGK